ncbi:MAG: hypothetical protein B9S37_02690 [Verrucomicrobiia bacterium Tous-C3TDCM]|nr:MAG: hypothetical protein B9S37_02690 [Verrucomicrobiae bacterium Tous-C3TDCM]PAZ07288.1 MAG: hypothetical protein CAK88_00860 [Verrucomicrobiae bacterium AMD-G2]
MWHDIVRFVRTADFDNRTSFALKIQSLTCHRTATGKDPLFFDPLHFLVESKLKNPRLSMMARNWAKQTVEKQDSHRKIANDFLANLR